MKSEKATIGSRLRRARESAKLTKGEAAEATGVQEAAITAWERGTTLPSLVQLKRVVQCYGVTSHQLLFGCTLIQFSEQEAVELARVAKSLPPGLAVKMDLLLTACQRAKALEMSS